MGKIMGYGLSAKQVACPRYGWYGRNSGQHIGSLTAHIPFWTPLYIAVQVIPTSNITGGIYIHVYKTKGFRGKVRI